MVYSMKFGARQKFFLTIVLSLVGLSFLSLVLIILLNQAKTASAVLRRSAEKIAELEIKRKLADEMRVLIKDRVEDLARINKFFVDRERPVDFIESLEEMAKKTKNRVAIDFNEARSKSKNLFFKLTIEGSENSVRKYLKLLELMPYKIRVEDLTFQKITISETPTFVRQPKGSEIPISQRIIVLIQVDTL